ncbi:MAG: 3-oxoacyl-[acyl-carrier-protein] reductase [Lentisphaerae bacterium]|nr:3-oxoacyl-[acyl-carrier-protein] reductase [Lentisphaerota bacterium]
MSEFNSKTVVVTGAARGIGQAIAVKFAAAGADLALCDLNAEWLSETAEAVEALGRKAKCYSVDVSNATQVQDTVSAILTDFGKIDVLINNAGITKDTFLLRMTEEDWDAVLAVNLKGTFLFSKAVSKPMLRQRSGNIVNIASIIGLIGNAGQCNYGASKAGVIAFTKSIAKELASRSIRVNAVAPGFIKTHMTDALPEDIQKKMLEAIPLGKFGLPEDVANVVLFLASESSAYMTGQVLTISGGMVM